MTTQHTEDSDAQPQHRGADTRGQPPLPTLTRSLAPAQIHAQHHMSRRASKVAASSAPADDAAAAAVSADSGNQAAHGNDGPNARHYNEQQYWDERYQKQLSGAAAASSSTRPAKKARAGADAAASAAADDAAADEELPDSADVTSDWYYSWGDLERLLRKAKVDTKAAALDVGCGMCNIFVDLQRAPNNAGAGAGPGEKAGAKRKASSAAAASSSSSSAAASAVAPGLGWTGRCIGLDYSPTVIAHMRQTYPDPSVQWVCADACYLIDEPETANAGKGKGSKKQKSTAAAAAPNAPPALSAADRALFTPGSFSLIFDKATSDGMLCSPQTAGLTSLLYATIARLLAPEGLYVLSSVNEPESAWFGELVVSSLIEHGGSDVCWQIEVHSPAQYKDGEEGAPHVYLIRKHIVQPSRARVSTQQQSQREPYTIKHCMY